MLLKAFRYAGQDRIFEFFAEVVRDSGNTFEQNLLGARGIGTLEPENIEAILSTNFTGESPPLPSLLPAARGRYEEEHDEGLTHASI